MGVKGLIEIRYDNKLDNVMLTDIRQIELRSQRQAVEMGDSFF